MAHAPGRTWWALFHADDRPVRIGYDEQDLRSWLLAGAPEHLFGVDPPEEATPEEHELLDAHVHAFMQQIAAVIADGIDPDWWMRSIAMQLHSCVDTCCRLPRFITALNEQGWWPHIGRGPWTSWR